MKPFEKCPVCQVEVRWIFYDGENTYDCSNKECPINFSEKILFSKDENNNNFDLTNGTLIYYHFDIDNFFVYVSSKFNVISVKRQGMSMSTAINIPIFDINWKNLELLKYKIKTIANFS